MSAAKPLSLLIVGDGLLGWLAAASLARVVGGDAIRVVPADGAEDGLGPFGPALLALPRWRVQALDEPPGEGALFRSASAAWALGIAYGGWSAPDAASFWPFGDVGAPLNTTPFHQLMARMRGAGRRVQPLDFSLAALAAQAGRIAPPSPDPRSPLSTLSPGLLLDARGLADAARSTAQKAGVRTLAPLRELRSADARVEALVLSDGSKARADLFIDCTGARRHLIDTVAPAGFDSWRARLPCDRVSVQSGNLDAPRSFAIHAAHAIGWTAAMPLAGTQVETRLSCSSFGGEGSPFESGAHRQPWCGNVVALGAAAMLVEPLHALPLMAAQESLALLAKLLPASDGGRVEAAEYNRVTSQRHARALDLTQMPYRVNGRSGEPFWDAAREAPVNEELAWKLSLFESRGRVPMLDQEPIDRADWLSLLEAAGLRQRRYDPLAEAIPLPAVEAYLGRLHQRLLATVQQMPPLAPNPHVQRQSA